MAEPQDVETKDFFVSYNRADREWAEWIAWTLEEAGHSMSDDFEYELFLSHNSEDKIVEESMPGL